MSGFKFGFKQLATRNVSTNANYRPHPLHTGDPSSRARSVPCMTRMLLHLGIVTGHPGTKAPKGVNFYMYAAVRRSVGPWPREDPPGVRYNAPGKEKKQQQRVGGLAGSMSLPIYRRWGRAATAGCPTPPPRTPGPPPPPSPRPPRPLPPPAPAPPPRHAGPGTARG